MAAETPEAAELKDKSGDRRYFVLTPQVVWAYCRNTYDLALWHTVKMVAGEDGECYLSTRDLAKLSMMSHGKITDCRDYLLSAGLLEGEIRRDPGRLPVYHLRIPDLWERNLAWRQAIGDKLADRVDWKVRQRASVHLLDEDPDEVGCPPHGQPVHQVGDLSTTKTGCPPDGTKGEQQSEIHPRSEKAAPTPEAPQAALTDGVVADASLSPDFQSMLAEATTTLELVVSDTLRHQLADAFQADPERIPGLLRYARAKGLGAGWFRKAALEGTRAPETPPGLQRKALVHADGSEEIIFLDSKGRRVQTFDRVGEDGELHSKPADILDWTNDDWRDVGGGAAMLAYQIHKRFDAGELDADVARERLRQCYRQELETRDRWHIHG